MIHAARFGLAVFLLSALATGCAVGVEDQDVAPVVTVQDTSPAPAMAPIQGEDGAASTTTIPGTDPVYFGRDNALEEVPSADAPPAYTFELVADVQVTIEISRRNEDGPNTIGFTLLRVTDKNQLVELGKSVGYLGSAAMSLHTEHGGFYAIRLLDGLRPETLLLSLACNSGSCTPRRQPGEVCASTGELQCDTGLVCLFEDGACESPKEPGRCQLAPKECDSEHAPVCGCDGSTWGNACFAKQRGVSILHDGMCKGD